MANEVNIYSPRYLAEVVRQTPAVHTYFRDTFFTNVKTFATERVDIDLVKGDRRMAAFVHPRVGGKVLKANGYKTESYKPPLINPYDVTTADQLMTRLPGEDLYSGMTPAQRAAQKLMEEYATLNDATTRREEWMCAQTMINNACTMQTYIDDKTEGEKLYVKFFDDASDHTYTVATKWNATGGDFFGDVKAMCRKLSKRGLRAADLVLGSDVADAILDMEKVQKLLDRNSGIIIGTIDQELSRYDGVVYMGTLNFGGFKLNLISVDETYVDDEGKVRPQFPKTDALVTAPGCGHLMYGAITQINYGDTKHTTIASRRVPKFSLNQENDLRKTILKARPLAAPHNYCPWIRVKNVVG